MSNLGAVDVGHHRRETTAKTEMHPKVQQRCSATRCRPLVDDLRNLAERDPRAKMRHEAVPILAVCAKQARAPTPVWRRQLSRLLREIVIMVSQHNLMWSTRLSMVVVTTKAGVCIEMNRWCRRSSRQVVIVSWVLKRKRKWLLLVHVVVVRI